MDILQILGEAVRRSASDIHLSVARPITFRVNGKLVSLDHQMLTPQDTEKFAKAIASEQHIAQVERIGGVDFGFNLERGVRFRASCFKQRGSFGIVLRLLPRTFYTFEQIGIPERVVGLLSRPRGLLLVTGPTGSGKTTTLATMINYINETRSDA